MCETYYCVRMVKNAHTHTLLRPNNKVIKRINPNVTRACQLCVCIGHYVAAIVCFECVSFLCLFCVSSKPRTHERVCAMSISSSWYVDLRCPKGRCKLSTDFALETNGGICVFARPSNELCIHRHAGRLRNIKGVNLLLPRAQIMITNMRSETKLRYKSPILCIFFHIYMLHTTNMCATTRCKCVASATG